MVREASWPLEIQLVIRFGSTVSGLTRADSDVDLAVLASRELTLADREQVVLELARRHGIQEDRIDLVDLRQAPPLLQHEIAEKGELLEGERDDFLRFRVSAWKVYQDTARLRRAREENRGASMPPEVLLKKLERLLTLLDELAVLHGKSQAEFVADRIGSRAAERDFQLLVNLAVDVNLYLIAERGHCTPDSYRQTFTDLAKLGILARPLVETLGRSAQLRNILVHEYDLDVDVEVFYRSAREFVEPYRQYAQAIHRALKS